MAMASWTAGSESKKLFEASLEVAFALKNTYRGLSPSQRYGIRARHMYVDTWSVNMPTTIWESAFNRKCRSDMLTLDRNSWVTVIGTYLLNYNSKENSSTYIIDYAPTRKWMS
jgi:hypothetical protein